jgi:hypothetical protein
MVIEFGKNFSLHFFCYKLIYEALQSLYSIYKYRNVSANELRRKLVLNITASLNLILQPPFIDTVGSLLFSVATTAADYTFDLNSQSVCGKHTI